MAIAPIETVPLNNPGAASTSGNGTIDKDDFLLLFVTQLQNQDPLSPMDTNELTAQTAQFSSLEQLQNINDKMEYLLKYQSAIFDENAVSFIDKNVKATIDSVALNAGVPVDLNFDLEKDADGVYVYIYDTYGDLVREINQTSPTSAGENRVTWDGNYNDGSRAPDGDYFVEIRAMDSDGITFVGVPFFEDIVTAVNYWNGTAYLTVGNREVPIGSVQKVTGADIDPSNS